MEFRLLYEGPLHGQGAKAPHKWEIRRALHPQLQQLWRAPPLKDVADTLLAFPARAGQASVVMEKDGLRFAPLVTRTLDLYAEISVLLFRQQPRGTLITDGGDIDNRLKTLLDGLRIPRGANEGRQERPDVPDPAPFFCLLEDDSLVTKVTVESEQLLRPAQPDEVLAVISVHVKKTRLTPQNMAI
ncbi:MAG: hypothetical protein ACK4ZD_10560 [Caldimonas sp.]|uniref:hypothetical protein n=1 Tax=Caldimonas sp. TaxID=2838790 RepID=UPI00391D2D9A